MSGRKLVARTSTILSETEGPTESSTPKVDDTSGLNQQTYDDGRTEVLDIEEPATQILEDEEEEQPHSDDRATIAHPIPAIATQTRDIKMSFDPTQSLGDMEVQMLDTIPSPTPGQNETQPNQLEKLHQEVSRLEQESSMILHLGNPASDQHNVNHHNRDEGISLIEAALKENGIEQQLWDSNASDFETGDRYTGDGSPTITQQMVIHQDSQGYHMANTNESTRNQQLYQHHQPQQQQQQLQQQEQQEQQQEEEEELEQT